MVAGTVLLFLVPAAVTIRVGTAFTMVLPFAWVNTEADRIASVTPYTPLQLAGRDVYIREGCNNCHTQTVRPLRTEVMRYGEYSKAGEFANDRPFLWGSKRTGPDLARIGGKYPDAWHQKHFANPQAFFDKSNMPAYGWLAGRKLDPEAMRTRMRVNGFPFTEQEIGALAGKSELDALVAYMQAIGAAVKGTAPAAAAAPPPDAKNPLARVAAAVADGRALYEANCASCHGKGGSGGDIGPGLEEESADDPDLYTIIAKGYEGEMPGYGDQLDSRQIWSIVSYIRSLKGERR